MTSTIIGLVAAHHCIVVPFLMINLLIFHEESLFFLHFSIVSKENQSQKAFLRLHVFPFMTVGLYRCPCWTFRWWCVTSSSFPDTSFHTELFGCVLCLNELMDMMSKCLNSIQSVLNISKLASGPLIHHLHSLQVWVNPLNDWYQKDNHSIPKLCLLAFSFVPSKSNTYPILFLNWTETRIRSLLDKELESCTAFFQC